jgi:hypothetical protein
MTALENDVGRPMHEDGVEGEGVRKEDKDVAIEVVDPGEAPCVDWPCVGEVSDEGTWVVGR